MGMLLGGLTGLGKGSILETLKRPIFSETVETFKYGRKGSCTEGLVIEHRTRLKEFSVGDAIMIFIIAGTIYLAANKTIRKAILDSLGVVGEAAGALGDAAFSGPIAETLKSVLDPLGLTDASIEEVQSVMDIVKQSTVGPYEDIYSAIKAFTIDPWKNLFD